jgi:hypothetical protein
MYRNKKEKEVKCKEFFRLEKKLQWITSVKILQLSSFLFYNLSQYTSVECSNRAQSNITNGIGFIMMVIIFLKIFIYVGILIKMN